MTSRDTSPADRRRKRAVIALLGLAGAAVVGLGNGLASCTPQSRAAETGQPASSAQIQRLASLRVNDSRDGRSGLRAVIGTPGSAVHLTGWVDWQRSLIYLSSTGDKPGGANGLVEAQPGVAAVRLGRPVPANDGTGLVDPYPPPPAQPPTDGWRVRRLSTTGPAASPLDGLLALILSLASGQPDDARALAAQAPRFLRRAMTAGVAVDVLTGPAVLPAAVTGPQRMPSTAPGAATVSYWLDDTGRLRRLDALLRKDLPVRVDFSRDDRTAPVAVEALGGAPVEARPATAAETALLARSAVRAKTVRGGRISLTMPYPPAGLLHGGGWLDWAKTEAYLAVQNADDAPHGALVWADRTGILTRPTPDAPAAPPAVPPRGGWGTQGDPDVNALLAAALIGPRPDATHLRTDTLGGVPVTVFEARGVRYWVDGSGLVRRVELQTATGGYGWLDVTAGPVPALTRPVR